jgi:hypothetical protein
MVKPCLLSRCPPGGPGRAAPNARKLPRRSPLFSATSHLFAASVKPEGDRCEHRGACRAWAQRISTSASGSIASGGQRSSASRCTPPVVAFWPAVPGVRSCSSSGCCCCHTLRFDTKCYAERWRGPALRPPGSPWPHRHPPEAGGTAREGDC